MKFKHLTEKQKRQVFSEIKCNFPYWDFEVIKGRPAKSGIGGSDADFVEISVVGLFDMVAELMYKDKK